MKAALCLRHGQTASKKPHCILNGTKPSLGRYHQYNHLRVRIATFAPFLNCGSLRAVNDNRSGLVARASGSPIQNADDEKANCDNKARSLAVRSVVSLAFVVGIMCSRRALLAHAAPSWPWSPAPVQTDVLPAAADPFDTRSEFMQLLDLLCEAKCSMKDWPIPMKMDEKVDSTSLINQFEKERGPLEKYEKGLSLIDILIKRGEYERAKTICTKLDPTAISITTDGRLPLLMFITELSIQLRSSRLENIPNWRQILVARKPDWEEYMTKYKRWSQPPSK